MKGRFTLLLVLAAALAFSTACNKADDAEKKEEGKAEGADVEAPKAVAGAATAPATETSPGKISIDQAIAVMGNDAINRIVVRLAPLAKSGLVEMGMSAMPPELKADYDKFVADSGFDPFKQVTGLLVFADGEISELQNARIVLLAELSPEVRTKFVAIFEKMDEGEVAQVEKKEMDGAIAMARVDEGMVRFVYLWQSGVVFGAAPDTGVAPLVACDAALKAILGELALASKADPSTSVVAIEARVLADGKNVEASLTLDDKLTLDLSVTLGDEEMNKAQGFVAGLPEMQKNPDAILAKAPPFLHDLGKLVLAGASVSVDGKKLVGHVQVDLAAFKAAVEPILVSLTQKEEQEEPVAIEEPSPEPVTMKAGGFDWVFEPAFVALADIKKIKCEYNSYIKMSDCKVTVAAKESFSGYLQGATFDEDGVSLGSVLGLGADRFTAGQSARVEFTLSNKDGVKKVVVSR